MRHFSIIFIAISGILVFHSCMKENNIKIVQSTSEGQWMESDIIPAKEISGDIVDISILREQKEQQIDGFGGCFNELGWDALNMLDSIKQEDILRAFFEPGAGFNFNICRMPIGANDYARDWYSLNDSAYDYGMEHFSVERDKKTLIPYIKRAMKYNPDLQVWGSPWCPPAWMKTNNHYACRPDVVNDLDPEGAGEEGTTQFIMDEKTLSAYALYFVKYVQTYTAEGVNVYAVHVQNEPNSCQNFPSCIWAPEDLNTFIGEYLGPTFDKHNLNTEIWLGTIERPYVENVSLVLDDEKSSRYVDGVGFQWAGKKAIPGVNEKYPEMKLMQTESECGDGSNDWEAAEYTWGLLKHYLNNGANTYLYWNFILDETGKSQWGWKQNSLITVNSQTSEATFNPEYYLMKHFSHFIRPGAYKLSIKGNYSEVLAFENPGGEIIVIIANMEKEQKHLQLKYDDKNITISLKPKSFNSLRIS